MSDECIHGLENGLCASCFPKAAPEAAAAAPRAVRAPVSRAREAASPTTLRTPPAPRGTSAAKSATVARTPGAKSATAPVGEQRIYHVTHIDNLAQILSTGSLLADASDDWDGRPNVDISAPTTRETRRQALVAGDGSRSVASYVPFFLSPDALVWAGIRSDDRDVRLSAEAHESAPYDYVVLVSTVGKATGSAAEESDAIVVSDGDAARPFTRFATTPEASERMLQKLRADQDSVAILDAEFLTADRFPFELVTLIGVANDRVREAVRKILASADFRPKVAVYPPWFQPAEQQGQ